MPIFQSSALSATLAGPSLLQKNATDIHHTADSRGTTGSAEPGEGPFLSSDDLLQGRKTVASAHNGFVYRLQATRLGKLILTK